MDYIISDKTYKLVKWAVLIVLPAVATLFSAVAAVWGMDAELINAIVTTLTALATFGGTVLGVSAVTGKPVEPDEGGDQ